MATARTVVPVTNARVDGSLVRRSPWSWESARPGRDPPDRHHHRPQHATPGDTTPGDTHTHRPTAATGRLLVVNPVKFRIDADVSENDRGQRRCSAGQRTLPHRRANDGDVPSRCQGVAGSNPVKPDRSKTASDLRKRRSEHPLPGRTDFGGRGRSTGGVRPGSGPIPAYGVLWRPSQRR